MYITIKFKLGDSLAQIERQVVEAVYDSQNKNSSATVRLLDIGIRTLRRKLKLWGYPPKQSTGNPHTAYKHFGEQQ